MTETKEQQAFQRKIGVYRIFNLIAIIIFIIGNAIWGHTEWFSNIGVVLILLVLFNISSILQTSKKLSSSDDKNSKG